MLQGLLCFLCVTQRQHQRPGIIMNDTDPPGFVTYGLVLLGLHSFLRLAHALYCRSRRCLASVAFSSYLLTVG